MRRGGSEEQIFFNHLKGQTMSALTTPTAAGATNVGVPPTPPEAHQGAVAEYLGTATYSPEDNKLRFYPLARLSAEDYQRAKLAGFSWAPRQQLFVAPMWTPGRADLMLQWCGEIGDEDRSLMQRAGERAERFEDYSEKRGQEADAARRSVEAITAGIPLGQPILIGHHSERRARKDAERIEAGMRKAVQLWETRAYWERRATAAKLHAEYKERDDVRYRRIKGIEADQRKAQRIIDHAELFTRLWAKPELSREQAIAIANRDSFFIPSETGHYSETPYSLLTKAEPWSVERIAALCSQRHARNIAHQKRWVEHYENRIAYERAMLGESGGLVGENAELQRGGRVLVRGEWLTIVRVNKKDGKAVSVTTNARYVRVRGLEEIEGYEAPTAEAAEAMKAATKKAPLTNYLHAGALEMTQAEWKSTHADYKGTREAGQGANSGYRRQFAGADDVAHHGLHRVRVVVRQGELRAVFLMDAKVVQPPAAEAAPEPRPTVPAPERAMPATPAVPPARQAAAGGDVFTDMRNTLRNGAVRVVSAPQLFPTPDAVAVRLMELAAPQIGARVLEPSAGTGALLQHLPGVLPFTGNRQTACTVVAVEVNQALAEALRTSGLAQTVVCADFLQQSPEQLGRFDVIVMNPPFERGSDIEHITHAQQFLLPGGRLVAVCADGPRQRALFSELGRYEQLPAGSFASQGTQVNTALVVLAA